jgi:hypothetical protein
VELDEMIEEVDVIGSLNFDENMIEEILSTHAGNQAYWEAMAARLKTRYESFEEETMKKWWAHNKTYAKYVLHSYGDKQPTLSAINDMVILIYSEDNTEETRNKYCDIAYNSYSKFAYRTYEKDEFRADMYKWVCSDSPWYFENMVRTEKKLKEDFEMVKIFAERLHSRSFHMKDYQNLLMAKKYNIGPTSYDERSMMGRMSRKERQ